MTKVILPMLVNLNIVPFELVSAAADAASRGVVHLEGVSGERDEEKEGLGIFWEEEEEEDNEDEPKWSWIHKEQLTIATHLIGKVEQTPPIILFQPHVLMPDFSC